MTRCAARCGCRTAVRVLEDGTDGDAHKPLVVAAEDHDVQWRRGDVALLRSKLELGPLEKWRRHRVFPLRLLVHVAVLAVVTVNAYTVSEVVSCVPERALRGARSGRVGHCPAPGRAAAATAWPRARRHTHTHAFDSYGLR